MRLILSIVLVFACCLPAFAKEKEELNQLALKALPPFEVIEGQGVSGHFAGLAGETVVAVGGCNFPTVPAAQGGSKVFYNDIYVLNAPLSDHAEWEKAGSLPSPLGYGVSVSSPQGLICIGGNDGTQSVSCVYCVQWNQGKVETSVLNHLPVALDNMAGCLHDGVIYVAGGQSFGVTSNRVFCIALNDLMLGKEWTELPSFPGLARVQPCAAVQSLAGTPYLYVLGGFQPNTEGQTGIVHGDGVALNLKTHEWVTTTNSGFSMIGATCAPVGGSHILVFGGVNPDIFEKAINRPEEGYLAHPVDWYRFNPEVVIYHTLTDVWFSEGDFPALAKAGAAIVPYHEGWIVIGGESKPGIRSSEVSFLQMEGTASFGWLNWCVLILYLVGMVLLGYFFMRKEKGGDDFFKGGGRIPWWAAGISIYATMLSAITYMAYPAKAYATNWTYYPMLVTILLVSFPVIKYYLPFFRRLNVTTAYEYLERRFSGAVRLMASAVFIVFMVARMALVLYLPSLALTAVTGINIWVCIALMGIVTIVYCTMGGVEAVIWGDVVQGFILVGGALLSATYLICATEGGGSGFIDIALSDGKLKMIDWSLDFTKATFWVVVLGGLANNLISYTSDQTVIQRYLTTKDEKNASHSILLNGVMSTVISIAFFLIGAGLYTFFKTHPAELDISMTKTDAIFPFFMMSQLPAGVAGLLIAAIFAATMSTISSNINSIATAFSVDFFKRWKPQTSDKDLLKVARYTCVVAGVIGVGLALLMASWDIYSLLDFFQEMLGLLSSGLGGLFLMGIFFPRINAKSALAGFIAGIVTVFCAKYLTQVNVLFYGFIGLAVSVVAGYAFSLISSNKKDMKGLTWKNLER